MIELDLGGLKSNWKAFKGFLQKEGKNNSVLTTYYFVFKEDTCNNESYIFTSHSDLDEWLSKMFWEWGRYEIENVESSMGDVNVWKLVVESEVKRLRKMYNGVRKTSIVIDGDKYYRKLVPVIVETSVNISTKFY
ncbi:hypothetical protein COK36_12685 [Bacillus cereus]|uniref:hypothetical protein n=1 Tax=Bacillus cereus TaxID=1396 RepID=UPI000BF3619E|nr:hypothetical protein [Bacillus cereus]PFR60375.1 hypothetical protein COK36_12685 [Bacillus cereus]